MTDNGGIEKRRWAGLTAGGYAIGWFLAFAMLSRDVGTALAAALAGGVLFFALALVVPRRQE